MKTIVICNQKGGVGKTTTTSALGAYLVNKGYRVLTIDSDPQGNLSSSIGINPDEVSTLDDLMTGKNTIQQVIIKTAIGDLISCSLSLSDADRRFTQFKAFEILKNILSEVNDSYDFTIIDAPPSLGIISLNDLIASDYVVVPVNAAAFSIQGIKALVSIIKEVKSDNKDLKIAGILVTRYNSRTTLGKDVIEVLKDIAEKIETKVFDSKIRQGVAIEAAQADQIDIFTAAPKSGVASDYESFCCELMNDILKENR